MADRSFDLATERLGPLPILNHFADRLGLETVLERFVPTKDRRRRLRYAKALGVLLRSMLVEREAIYRQGEIVSTFAPESFGLDREEVALLGDDALGRALDRLFDADRGGLVTDIVVAVRERFRVDFDELHNDSTTIRFTGQYPQARGRSIRGKRAPWITYGYSKDHRPDLKQLLWVLTSTRDGGVPVQFRCEDGNTNDTSTHLATWQALCDVAGRSDFLYVADSKLCVTETMDYLDRHGGRFVTVLPRSRLEDEEFRRWIQTHEPPWELVWDRRNPRRKRGPRDRWWAFRHPLSSQEGWPVIWVKSSLLALHQQASRRERIAKATEELEDLQESLLRGKSRLRDRSEVKARIEGILGRNKVKRYLAVQVDTDQTHRYRQVTRGRPGSDTRYRRETRKRFRLHWRQDDDAIAYDHRSDGMYPLLTNDKDLSPKTVLEAHKRQPRIEKRFQQLKSVQVIAPVFLKNEARVEAFFLVYFLALLLQALIEREIRQGMQRYKVQELALYPEERACKHPTSEQVLRLFSFAERHLLYRGGRLIEIFDPKLTDLQHQVLLLLGVSGNAYRSRG